MARPVTHVVAPSPAVQHLDVRDHQSPFGASDSVPSTPNPLPPGSRRGTAPSPPSLSPYHKQKTFLSTPNSTPPLPSKPPPSPGNRRRPPTSGGNPLPAAPCGAPVSLSAAGSDSGSDLQHQVSVSHRRKASSPGGHTPTRGMAPPPPSSSPVSCHQEAPRAPHPPCRETTAPPVHVREAPPPPPVRSLGSPSLPSDHPVRVKPPAPPPPPPPQSGNASPTCSASSLNAEFESRFSFHRVEDFPPPEIFKLLTNVYPSKAQKVMRGAPPLPPVGR
ncbi:WAS/WASL-interacting protein family member 2-like [Synchiropus splendidus]|uniref:WAS/WASL-interacting protein family member 2-like n=1 Tax=Synchiropus splendidus TaxID=270530 RepID=UPI00237E6E8E|nr:WAS/WASL-interacting protein family member 2-like [Synchiropus splendidus]